MKQPKNIAASIRARLLNLARENDEDYNSLLLRFVRERLLYRLSQSPHASEFVLKGAALFSLWDGQPHRPTKDTDFLSFGAPNPEPLRSMFADIVGVGCADDGLVFDAAAITANPIREHAIYDGIRINIPVRLGTFRTQTQVDVGFGDAIVPEPVEATYPTLLDLPAPTILAYRRETVVAEKLEAVVSLGMTNSRMKDFYNLLTLGGGYARTWAAVSLDPPATAHECIKLTGLLSAAWLVLRSFSNAGSQNHLLARMKTQE